VNPFRIRAYRNAARTIGGLGIDVKTIADDVKKLKSAPGIGDDLAVKIREVVATGRCELLDRLRSQVPPAVAELLHVPGIGPKRVRTLYQELEVQTLEQLLRAPDARRSWSNSPI
jgi:DNA polymerase (family X)